MLGDSYKHCGLALAVWAAVLRDFCARPGWAQD